MQQPRAYTVSAITRIIKEQLEGTLAGIWVEGEISNYHLHTSGHRYFNLKDDRAVLRVTLWRSVASYLKFEPEDGQKVLAFGDITVYERGGNYQLNCRKLVPVGIGELELAFRQLFEKLSAQGFFEEERKKPLPPFPLRIGVVTSPTGAAIRDILQIAARRNPAVEMIIYPAQVQGDGAEDTIAAGIEYFNTRDDIDLIITGRGGGSLEDLWCFNTEVVVRAIAASRLPTVSAVGHEIDTTLSDLAADERAPTPSAAAELVVWSRAEYLRGVSTLLQQQAAALRQATSQGRQQLEALTRRPVLRHPIQLLAPRQQRLDIVIARLNTAAKNSFDSCRSRLSLNAARLEALSPVRVLARGYSVSRKLPGGEIMRSIRQVEPGDRLETLVADGRVESIVESAEIAKKDAGKDQA